MYVEIFRPNLVEISTFPLICIFILPQTTKTVTQVKLKLFDTYTVYA